MTVIILHFTLATKLIFSLFFYSTRTLSKIYALVDALSDGCRWSRCIPKRKSSLIIYSEQDSSINFFPPLLNVATHVPYEMRKYFSWMRIKIDNWIIINCSDSVELNNIIDESQLLLQAMSINLEKNLNLNKNGIKILFLIFDWKYFLHFSLEK